MEDLAGELTQVGEEWRIALRGSVLKGGCDIDLLHGVRYGGCMWYRDVCGRGDISAVLQGGLGEFLGEVFGWVIGVVGCWCPALWLCDLGFEGVEWEERGIW